MLASNYVAGTKEKFFEQAYLLKGVAGKVPATPSRIMNNSALFLGLFSLRVWGGFSDSGKNGAAPRQE